LFSTVSTFDSGIYQEGIIKGGHEFIFKEGWQAILNSLIQSIKLNKDNPANAELWKELVAEVHKESIDSIIIACTDLNVVLAKAKPSANIIDSSKCLAGTVVRRYLYEVDK